MPPLTQTGARYYGFIPIDRAPAVPAASVPPLSPGRARRYRYYVSRPLITNDQTERSAGLRVPAGEIEQGVTKPPCGPIPSSEFTGNLARSSLEGRNSRENRATNPMAWSTIPCVVEQGNLFRLNRELNRAIRESISLIRELSAADVGPLLNPRTKVPKLQSTRGSPRVSPSASARKVISAKMAGDRRFRA